MSLKKNVKNIPIAFSEETKSIAATIKIIMEDVIIDDDHRRTISHTIEAATDAINSNKMPKLIKDNRINFFSTIDTNN